MFRSDRPSRLFDPQDLLSTSAGETCILWKDHSTSNVPTWRARVRYPPEAQALSKYRRRGFWYPFATAHGWPCCTARTRWTANFISATRAALTGPKLEQPDICGGLVWAFSAASVSRRPWKDISKNASQLFHASEFGSGVWYGPATCPVQPAGICPWSQPLSHPIRLFLSCIYSNGWIVRCISLVGCRLKASLIWGDVLGVWEESRNRPGAYELAAWVSIMPNNMSHL
jgi:hypothetical protein